MGKKLIYCKDLETKISLLKRGLPLIHESDGVSIFANSTSKHINFDDISDKIMFSNKMTFL